ncbi:zinc finger CCCH domain-containing protein 3 isoform X2 [Neoarius graeffei]|uniref:zinc finger CCCH domain-containing protein 3 isoform X2 n=1 Tax=Neoarius graeffei TaxID=443677 RepID=UPI00298D4B64|nr:zinc finger CCCH domain-containing protein 3 isoform X2 [Neoarius graeffei]
MTKDSNMEEREALEREIEKLQNLIKDHKRAHGDVPLSSSQRFSTKHGLGRSRSNNPYYVPSYSHQPQLYAPHSSSQWSKKYSLNNKSIRAPGGRSSQISEANPKNTGQVQGAASDACSLSSGVSKVLHKGMSTTRTVPSCSVMGKESSLGSNKVPADGGGKKILKPTRTNIESMADPAESALLKREQQSGLNVKMRQSAMSDLSCSATLLVPLSGESSAFKKKQAVLPQGKSSLRSNVVIMPTTDSPPLTSSTPTSKVRLEAGSAPEVQPALSPRKKSRFTWVKSQSTETSQKESEMLKFSPSSLSASTASPVVAKHTHTSSKKLHRKLALSPSTLRTSKYSWVSASCSPTAAAKSPVANLPYKLFSPKALKVPGKTVKEGVEGKKLPTAAVLSKRAKVSGGASTSHASHGSRYSWKAVAATSATVVRSSTPKSSRKSSVYRWTAQEDKKDLVSRVPHSPSSLLSSSGFKLRSRTKIIRRCSNSPASERRPSVGVVTVRSQYSLRRRTHIPVKSPSGARRGQSRVLVSLGRHKLRCLSPSSFVAAPWSSRTGMAMDVHGPFSPSVRNPASHRVINTRYKLDTRRAHLQHHSPALSYRVKRVQSARFLLQSRLRATPDGQWRGRGMRWIGGALYRVSANKLSRTHTPCTPSNISEKLFSPQDLSFGSSTCRTSNTRRAVQKSLAIIRHAQQKKQQAKNYCMYYNRFGKCNRGKACPYIHDPDKVAVCTRFLRGTCKQTDGTCPFSHKVSKEKMPVCSYFLKGICNNSSCPYSHVYVSRKAAVCQDFIRGYCPQGEKCKKKHTLVCPDFSRTGVCPQGTKCKLQHRQRVKRSGSNLSSGSSKRARSREATKSPRREPESTPAEEGTPKSGPEKLPSFISLSSSPETPECSVGPSCPPGAGAKGTGKKLHIKPRFLSQK